MKRLLIICLVSLFGVAMTASPCWACSCAGQTKKEAGDSADAVFYGKVVHITYPDEPDPGQPSGGGNLKVRFWVQTVYKGKNISRHEVVRTAAQGSACGVGFEEGERYTVFAIRHKGFETNSCMATKEGNINPNNYGLSEGHPPED